MGNAHSQARPQRGTPGQRVKRARRTTEVKVLQKSLRTCVGCRTVTSPDQLVRVTVEPTKSGQRAVLDGFHRLGGRGAWVHPSIECWGPAVRKRAFNRAFRGPVDTEDLGKHLNALPSAR